ncbi:hypothetical protein [Vibrio harveyi]|uniref:hypothetical protein n=1 Tax=Vibrio harveyi TaxID=669 RepID=UPI001263DC1C|nr:hypothetical protein [Vibrio harveyi]QFQ76877.1 hypothetical protein F9277_05115 [Vibrio harveyi]
MTEHMRHITTIEHRKKIALDVLNAMLNTDHKVDVLIQSKNEEPNDNFIDFEIKDEKIKWAIVNTINEDDDVDTRLVIRFDYNKDINLIYDLKQLFLDEDEFNLPEYEDRTVGPCGLLRINDMLFTSQSMFINDNEDKAFVLLIKIFDQTTHDHKGLLV